LVEERLKELGIEIADIPKPLGSYKPCVRTSNLLYISGQLPVRSGELLYEGKIGNEIKIEEGKEAARVAAINCISVLKNEVGDLDKVERIVRVTGYISSASGFTGQANVLNGASDLFYDVFGQKGIHSRVAVGVFELPLGSPVEIDLIAEVSP